jgi:KaiC/GvpD/RAD55 family RecA-like ATPase
MSESTPSPSSPPVSVATEETDGVLAAPFANTSVDQPKAVDAVRLLSKFLQTPGHVLLVQGSPGSGKTSLALEILSTMEKTHKLYASTRVSPVKLRKHFPWLDEVIDNMTGRTSKATWIDELHDLRRTEPDNIFNQILRLKHSKRAALLVIDSWEGASRNTNEEGRRMMESAIFSELDESGVSVVIVSEGRSSGLDYLVDGIVTLNGSEAEGRKLRTLEILKLRGVKVSSPRLLFSLDKARFTQLPPLPSYEDPVASKTLAVVPHSTNLFSTGSRDLDGLLGGGFRKGAFVLLELDSTVPPLGLRLIMNIIRANFVKQGGACFIVPTGSYSSQNVAESLGPLVGEETLNEKVRIAEYNSTAPDAKWRMLLKGEFMTDINTFYKSWTALARNSSSMMLNVDLDKLVQVYGEDLALPGFAGLGEGMRDVGALNLGMASRDTKVKEEFLRTADYHLRVKMTDGSLLVSGVKPFTPLYGVRFSHNGHPELTLVEVV